MKELKGLIYYTGGGVFASRDVYNSFVNCSVTISFDNEEPVSVIGGCIPVYEVYYKKNNGLFLSGRGTIGRITEHKVRKIADENNDETETITTTISWVGCEAEDYLDDSINYLKYLSE